MVSYTTFAASLGRDLAGRRLGCGSSIKLTKADLYNPQFILLLDVIPVGFEMNSSCNAETP